MTQQLNWDILHTQTQQQLCEAAKLGDISGREWVKIAPLTQAILAMALERRTAGKLTLKLLEVDDEKV